MIGKVSWKKFIKFLGNKKIFNFIATLEDMQILDNVSPDALVFLQTHKRIWPASQRDALFWSHMRRIKDGLDADAHDVWTVCNHSTEHEQYPVRSRKLAINNLVLINIFFFSACKPRKMC